MRAAAALVLLFALAIVPVPRPAFCQDEKMDELRRKIEQEKKEIEKLTGQEKTLTLSLSEINRRLKELRARIQTTEKNQRRVESELKTLYAENDRISRQIAEKRGAIEKRLVIWQKTFLLKTDSPLQNINEPILFEGYMRHIFKVDRTLMNELTTIGESLGRNIGEIGRKKKEIEAIEADLRQKKADQEQLEKKQRTHLKTTRKEKEVHARSLRDAEIALRRLESLVKKAEEMPEYAGRGLGRGVLPYPVKGDIVGRFGIEEGSSKGARLTRKGIEISARDGANVRVVDDGRIVYTGWIRNLGTICIVSHGKRFYTVYGRLAAASVKKGDEVRQGDVIGTVGTEASFYEYPTLYFEIRERERPVNPEHWLR